MRQYRRDVEAVLREHLELSAEYATAWKQHPPAVQAYLVSGAEDARGLHHRQIIDGNLVSGAMYEERTLLLNRVVRSVLSYNPTVVAEFGCGIGRNLLAIKRCRPSVRCIGVELAAPAVELANMASEYYRLPLVVSAADITKPLRLQPVDVCFSVQALEDIRDSSLVFEQMRSCSLKAVVLFEPISELYPHSIRGLAARLRLRHLGRLANLYSYIRQCGYPVTQAKLLPHAGNALNPIAEVHVSRAGVA